MPQLIAILDYKSVNMNLANAEKQHISATNMEKLTHEMREIALKTEEETISMRVVTIVTLLFLPGTFVSVSLAESIRSGGDHVSLLLTLIQTVMSTPIIQYPLGNDGRPTRAFSPAALKIWIAVTVPLMFFTVLGSLIFKWRENATAHTKRLKLDFDPHEAEV